MEKNLETKYDHLKVESGKYDEWVKKGYFTAGDKSKDPFTIVIPPPNVTGILHIGHAWDNTLQDIISRYKRMQGYDVMFLTGTDEHGLKIQRKAEAKGVTPKLSVVIVGESPASQSYVRGTKKSCAENGFDCEVIALDESVSQLELIKVNPTLKFKVYAIQRDGFDTPDDAWDAVILEKGE